MDNGIAMVSQTVLLKGVNDDPAVLGELLRAFVETRVKPYYLHHPDLAPGTRHFRLPIAEGQALMRALRGRLSGLALPVGHRDATLLIAAEDHLVMQELSFLTPEILDRVNAFLEEDRFQEVHLSLLGKRRPLNAPRLSAPPVPPRPP